MATVITRLLVGTAAAWLVMAGIIVGRFADEALPASYLIRPLAVSAVVAVGIGAASTAAGRHAAIIAAGVALLVSLARPEVVLVLAGIVIVLELLRRRRGFLPETQRPTLVLVGIFLATAVVRAVPAVDLPAAGVEPANAGPPTYVVLLDGYPRMDTLAALGFDNQPFIAALEARGFDHYPTAYSLHGWTDKTLLAMLTDEEVADGPSEIAEKRAIRDRLAVPAGFVAIDPPVGHVTLADGPHLESGGTTDFEGHLLAQSVAAVIAPDWSWSLLIGGLLDRLEDQLVLLESTTARRVFAHLMTPHPPFMLGRDGPQVPDRGCWPTCHVFDSAVERLGISSEAWAAAMSEQLDGLNARVLETIDRLIAAHPDAVIVLFSDHGGRYSYGEPDEWHRSFLVSRTPGYPRLFDEAPRPDTIIRALERTYFPE